MSGYHKLSNLSIWCDHQMVTFHASVVNLYQPTRSDRGVAWGRGYNDPNACMHMYVYAF